MAQKAKSDKDKKEDVKVEVLAETLYEQNCERFYMQKLGHVGAGVVLFAGIGDVDAKFELQFSPTGITQVTEMPHR